MKKQITFAAASLLVLAAIFSGVPRAAAQRQQEVEKLIQRGADSLRRNDWKGAADSYRKAVRADPKNYEANYGLGVASMNLKQTMDALAAFSNVIEVKPNPRVQDAYVGTALIHYNLGHYKEARDSFELAQQLGPLSTFAAYLLGKSYMQTDHDALALAPLERASSDPQYAEDSLLSIGVIRMKQNQGRQAVQPLEGAVRINPRNASAQMLLGVAYITVDRNQEALTALRAAQAIDPNQFYTYFGLGYAHLALGHNEESVAAFTAALRLQPQSPDAIVGLGNAYARMNRYREAEQSFQQALQLKPEMPEALIGMCVVYYSQGNYPLMLSTAQQAARLAPQNVDAHLTLAAAYAITGDMRDGTAEASEALRLDAGIYGPHYVLGFILIREDKPQDALAEARDAARIRSDLADTQNLLAYVLNQTGQNRDALAAAQEALRLKREPSDEGWANYNIATASDKLGQHDAALEAYRRALAAYQNAGRTLDPDELYLMGNAYLNLEQDAQAIAAFRQAIKVRPTFAQAHYNLGVAFFAAGNRTAAMAEYNELKRLDPARAAKLLSVIRK